MHSQLKFIKISTPIYLQNLKPLKEPKDFRIEDDK